MENKREQILETANLIINKQGLKELTLAKIASEMGISKGTLYYYYKSKTDLLFDLADKYMNLMTDKFLEVVNNARNNDDDVKIIDDIYKTIVEHGNRNKIHIYLIYEALSGNDEIQVKYQVVYKKWLKMIKESIDQLSKDSNDENFILAQILLSSIDGMVLQSLLGIKDIPLTDISKYIVKNMLDKEGE